MTQQKLRIGFMGTPDFAASALAALCDTPHDIICVYSQPPRPKGRGHKVQLSPVHALAEERGIPVYTPLNFKDQAAIEIFQNHKLDVAIVAAYGLILPQVILDSPTFGCINIHASLLPRWRGASPIQHVIWKGDSETGIGLMQMEAGLDTGPVIMEERLPIAQETTTHNLHNALSEMGAGMVVECVERLAALKREGAKAGDRLPATPQTGNATYAPLLSKNDGRIDWTQTTTEIDRQIRALNPWPGVWTMLDGKRIKILTARPIPQQSKALSGTILNKSGHTACGDGTTLQLETLQPEGKKPMDFASALNGSYLAIGDKLK